MTNNELRPESIRRKDYITRICKQCGKEFSLVPWQARGKQMRAFCSKPCSSVFNNTGMIKSPREERKCPICEKIYTRTEKDAIAGRKATCSFECGMEATGRSKIKNPDGYPTARQVQRNETFKSRQQCDHCGYKEIPDLLVIHHIDHNPLNGNPKNILLLCPMCHALEHYRLKTGWFTKVRHGTNPVNH